MNLKRLSFEKILDLPVSAASGLVRIKDLFYTVADDALTLILFSESRVVETFPLVFGVLPMDHQERKERKPDWESLVVIQDKILVVPSGSKSNRQMGIWVELREPTKKTKKIDFSEIFKAFENEFSELNIEGAVVVGKYLRLFQRGNGPSKQNGFIDLDIYGVLEDLEKFKSLSRERIVGMKSVELGEWNGVPLGFTDACGSSFIAAAEDTSSTYDDGEYKGSVLGQLIDDEISLLAELDIPHKPEGLWVEGHHLFVVTDSDNPDIKSSLYKSTI